MQELILTIIPIMISSVALIVSIIVAWSNRKTIQVETPKNLEAVKGGSIFYLDGEGIPEPYDHALLGVIEVVNPSPKDIAFFDLRVFYPETNMNTDILTKQTIFEQHRNKPVWRAIEMPNGSVRLMELLIPETNYGVFKANSFTRFHIIAFPDEDAKEVLLSFKVAIKTRSKRDYFAVTGRKVFKMYGRRYPIKSWATSLKQDEQ